MASKHPHPLAGHSPPWIILAITTLLATLLTFVHVTMTIRNISRLERMIPTLPEYSWHNGDRPNEASIQLDAKSVVWEDVSDTFTLHNDTAWGSVFATDGSVRGGSGNQTYLVSMIHQLHCLDLIRAAYVTKKTDFPGHVGHCMRYLLQAVLCNADPTLEEEGWEIVDGKTVHYVHQWGVEHNCRDRSALEKYLIENEAKQEAFGHV